MDGQNLLETDEDKFIQNLLLQVSDLLELRR